MLTDEQWAARDARGLPRLGRRLAGGLRTARAAVAMAARGAVGLGKFALGRRLPADHPEVVRRLAICRACEHCTPPPERCGRLLEALQPGSQTCGCLLAAKARLPGARCPEYPRRWWQLPDPF